MITYKLCDNGLNSLHRRIKKHAYAPVNLLLLKLRNKGFCTIEKIEHQIQKVSQLLYDSNPSLFGHYRQERKQRPKVLLVEQKDRISCLPDNPPEVGKLFEDWKIKQNA